MADKMHHSVRIYAMKRWLWVGFFFFILDNLHAQQAEYIITGKVIDQSTQLPLAGASVFCQNTTIGVISNSEGNFTLRLPNGGYDLIISYTGYETFQQRISSENATTPLSIELKKQDKSLQEVAVVGTNEVADGWTKYGQVFLANFIGTTTNAALCKLENRDSLHFYYSKRRNKLKILTNSELVIVNNALGYKIRYQLDSFVHEYANGISTFSGYPLFEEMDGSDSQKVVWNTNRIKAYNGSRMHFMRSWYDSSLANQGFVIERMPDSTAVEGVPLANAFDSSFY